MSRWRSLDVLRGTALFMMVAHHLAMWTGGHVEERFVGFERLAVTHLAAPMFCVAAGAAAVLVGERVRGWRGWWGLVRRWGMIFLLGVVIDLVDGTLAGGGVLPTLALVGFGCTALVALGVRTPLAWWGITVATVFVVVPATDEKVEGFWPQLLHGRFALPVFLVLAAAGAAVAAHVRGRGEEALPLGRAALGIVGVSLLLSEVVPDRVLADGIWPPRRYPGDLAFTTWGLAATFALWAVFRVGVAYAPRFTAAVERAGQRTLLVFAGHMLVRVVLRETGNLGDLDTRAWGYAVWALTFAICAAACLPWPTIRRGAPVPE